MYNLKLEDLGQYILKFIITDKNINVNLIKNEISINIETFELPMSKSFNKGIFPIKFIGFLDDINENSIKAIRFRKKNNITLLSYIKNNGKRFIIDFLPMYKNILKRHNQAHFEFEEYEDFENKIYYLLEDIMKIKM